VGAYGVRLGKLPSRVRIDPGGVYSCVAASLSVCTIHTVNSRGVLRRLKAAGWVEVRQKGSHVQLKHPDRMGLVTVPHPKRDLPKGTVRSIERQSGLRLLG